MKTLGITLIIIGISIFLISGNGLQTDKNILHAGSTNMNRKKLPDINWLRYGGCTALAAGFIILLVSKKK